VAAYLCPCSPITDHFQNSFTGTLCGQFAIMWLLYIPLHHKYVSTLACKIYKYIKYECDNNKQTLC